MQDRATTILSQAEIITKCMTESRKELTLGLEARDRWDDMMTHRALRDEQEKQDVM